MFVFATRVFTDENFDADSDFQVSSKSSFSQAHAQLGQQKTSPHTL
jgi:hypothetical protein